MRCLPSFFGQHANLIGPSFQKKEIMETPQKRRLYFEMISSSPLAHLYQVGKNEEKSFLSPPTHPPQNIKRKQTRHLECMLGPYHWLHEISLSKRLYHHFWHGLTPLAKKTPLIQCWGTFDF